MSKPRPLMLLILDGWGQREAADDNAITTGRTPNWDALWADRPHTLLVTSGESVGLPAGQMGNSEVGHMNLGAGRIVYQELTRIGKAIADGSFTRNPALLGGVEKAKAAGGCVHIMGLLSPGGVHSHEDHLLATLELALAHGASEVAVHAFLDGRDVAPRSAADSIDRLEAAVAKDDRARIASVSGRYYAMDRDQRWERTELAWNAIVEAEAEHRADTARAALGDAYARNEDDEFVRPTVIDGGRKVEDGDAVLFINFRADRARQLTRAFVEPGFDGFECRRPALSAMVTMTHYLDGLPVDIAFDPQRFDHLFGAELAAAGLRQLRIAETEKYAHVTYFFNGGEEQVFEGEDRKLIPSPSVATYDLQPEMSAPKLTRELVEAIESDDYDVIICNVANPDMVGHSGKFEAAVEAVEAVDHVLGEVLPVLERAGGEALITADHGNVEQMSDPETGQPHTSHTTNPVPLVYFGPRAVQLTDGGSLRDIAPTMLAMLELPHPSEMTGESLIRLD
ncbi:2,3-bisphosphoglycerate-independent phosphoglycerate mutase [Wenzhouxiangella sp. EGI_FJ10305]|uniref:2,3-bisphosphoglycerate-independent phosphoglycerate mutase n=1 Tax=Wenzhouxiangella sp. EGI_FJ10305 TaxID=3243768 RepID=UPI0035D76CBC